MASSHPKDSFEEVFGNKSKVLVVTAHSDELKIGDKYYEQPRYLKGL